jgi:hypothetical protein
MKEDKKAEIALQAKHNQRFPGRVSSASSDKKNNNKTK